MKILDPRITPARPDLAAEHLRGQVTADRFVTGVPCQVTAEIAPVRRNPGHDAALETQALQGERVTVYETTDEGWAWGQLARDGYVGWLPSADLSNAVTTPTHRVRTLHTLGFPAANIKLPPVLSLPFGAEVTIAHDDRMFAVTTTGVYLPQRHLAPVGEIDSDTVTVAERFLGMPYLWGGKSARGIDCSGLVQVSLQACGIEAPRDSDMQEHSLGAGVPLKEIRRGDLVFWKGHVAIVHDATMLLHANAFHMQVAFEPLHEAIARIATGGSEVTSVRRPRPAPAR